jgi:hypothetical protein
LITRTILSKEYRAPRFVVFSTYLLPCAGIYTFL